MTAPKIEILRVFQSDADELVAAREKAGVIHHTRDIGAAGDEVEKAVRRFFERRLPLNYYAGHGHIVDSGLRTSRQFDIVIADNHSAPILFKTESGAEYFAFESVYALGEVKSAYYSSQKYVDAFVDAIKDVRTKLERKPVPPNYIGNGIYLGDQLSVDIKVPYQNPLFSFMLFVSEGDFEASQLAELYQNTPVEFLPNAVCILNAGLIVNCRLPVGEQAPTPHVMLRPEFAEPQDGFEDRWCLLQFGDQDMRTGSNLVALYSLIVEHVTGCRLVPPNMRAYLSSLLHCCGHNIT
jgi:hypothetical protein